MNQERAAKTTKQEPKLELRNGALAGALEWLVPGAGHWYQGRRFKAIIYGVSVWTLLVAGLAMGSFRAPVPGGDGVESLQFARSAYCSWRPGDRRLAFIPQACVGVVALPAIFQARFPKDADGSFWSTAFAPPAIATDVAERPNQPTLNEIAGRLHSWFDLSTLYTLTAGLLNLLAIFDAIAGPSLFRDEEKNERNEEQKDKKASAGSAA